MLIKRLALNSGHVSTSENASGSPGVSPAEQLETAEVGADVGTLFMPPIGEDLLRKHNFLTLYPMDGGGSLFARSRFESLDDSKMGPYILGADALADWGRMPTLDFGRHERWRSVEKSCWLNRMYWVVSAARWYWMTGDESVARQIRDTVLHFIQTCPPPRGEAAIADHIETVNHARDTEYNQTTPEAHEANESDIQYIWYDFQPASRLIHLIYALYFLRESTSFTPGDTAAIRENLYEHAVTILVGEQHMNVLERRCNHQSLRGLALLYAAAYLKGSEKSRDFIRQGLRICNFHIRNDFLPDGVLGEVSPSYHCFEAWHVRDAVLLSRQHGFDLCPEADAQLTKATSFIETVRQPDGMCPVINDGYALDVGPLVASFGLPEADAGTGPVRKVFPNAGLACYNDSSRYALLDASPFTGQASHYHAGKNAITYWCGGRPFLVDSGCCSYDDPLFADWYKHAEAHSSLLIDGQGDGEVLGTYDWNHFAEPKCDAWKQEGRDDVIASELTSGAPSWRGVTWTRTLRIAPDGPVTVLDDVRMPEPRRLCFVFNLHPDVRLSLEQHGALLKNDNVRLLLRTTTDGGSELQVSLEAGRCFIDNKHRENQRVLVVVRGGDRVQMTTQVECSNG